MWATLLRYAKSKTVWGTLFLAAAAHVPSPYSEPLKTIGTTLLGVGVADKLDKIKSAVQDSGSPEAPKQ